MLKKNLRTKCNKNEDIKLIRIAEQTYLWEHFNFI